MATRAPITLSTLRTRVRDEADMPTGGIIADAEMNRYLSQSYTKLYARLYKSGIFYYRSTQTISTSGSGTVALPSDYLGTLAVDFQLDASPRWTSVRPLQFFNRNAYPPTGGRALRYEIVGSNLLFYPTPPSGQTYRHIYVPSPADLTADGDTVDGIAGYEEALVLDTAIKCRLKEESDVSALVARLAEENLRIEEEATLRMMRDTPGIEDVNAIDDVDPANWWPYTGIKWIS